MATLRQPRPVPPPPERALALEWVLRFEPTWDLARFVLDDGDVTDTDGWRDALKEWLALTSTPDVQPYVARGAAYQRFPDTWPTSAEAAAAQARRDAVVAAGGSVADAIDAMHPPGGCTCRRHAAEMTT